MYRLCAGRAAGGSLIGSRISLRSPIMRSSLRNSLISTKQSPSVKDEALSHHNRQPQLRPASVDESGAVLRTTSALLTASETTRQDRDVVVDTRGGAPSSANADAGAAARQADHEGGLRLATVGLKLNHYDGLLKTLKVHHARLQFEYSMNTLKFSDIALAVPTSMEQHLCGLIQGVPDTGCDDGFLSTCDISSSASQLDPLTLLPDQDLIDFNEPKKSASSRRQVVAVDPERAVDIEETSLKDTCASTNLQNVFGPVPNLVRWADSEHRQAKVEKILTCFIEVSILCRDFTKPLQVLKYYSYRHKRQQERRNVKVIQPLPTSLYNALLSGYALYGKLGLAKSLHLLMKEYGVPLDVHSYAYLFAVGKNYKKKWLSDLMTSMNQQDISVDKLLREPIFVKEQREDLIQAIRRVQPSTEIPIKTFPTEYSCRLLQNIHKSRATFTGKKPVISLDVLKSGAARQWSRELDGFVKVKSLAAVREPTPRMLLLRAKVAELEKTWAKEISEIFTSELRSLGNHAESRREITIYPFLRVVEPQAVVDLLIKELRQLAFSSEAYSSSMGSLCTLLGRRFYDLHMVAAKKEYGISAKLCELYNEYIKDFDSCITRPDRELWQDLISRHSQKGPTVDGIERIEWPVSVLIGVGRFLYQVLRQVQIDVSMLRNNSRYAIMMNAIYTTIRPNGVGQQVREEVKVHGTLSRLYQGARLEDLDFNVNLVPMLCPPRPWYSPLDSTFLLSHASFLRLPVGGSPQSEMIKKAPIQSLYPSCDSLNVLSRCPWRINKPILDLVIKVFLDGGDIKLSVPVSPEKIQLPSFSGTPTKQEQAKAQKKYKMKCAEAYSLWCDMLYKLSIANHFRDDVFWFPHNMDFRGRVYPCPPHFNHLGSDVVRSVLMFAEGKPLGPNGLMWLKLHLINLTGFMKRRSIAERLQYVEEIMDDILDSADNPLTGRKWWQTSDDPWQTLAACREVANALRFGPDPSEYICHFPIHQDGSCNGLQHYAALGRDEIGAVQVNLTPMDVPQDVYSGVAEMVERLRQADADAGDPIAKLLEGHIKRKVVKQTVMTVVYGVTRYGAHLQILRQLQDLDDFPQDKAVSAAHYLVKNTFLSLREMFTATREIQDWFTSCASWIVKATGRPLEWVTPLGLPILQPYFVSTQNRSEISYGETIRRSTYGEFTDRPHPLKQKNAFPPNFIHSLDSSHMMLTALYAQAAGITFMSVHDCFWTHPSTVEIMNKICREQFVALHSEPILENLSKQFTSRFAFSQVDIRNDGTLRDLVKLKVNNVITRIPEKGNFDLTKVLESTYFFS